MPEDMYLSRLILTNFKNYTESDLGFSDHINCFIGDNGVGKTNILDSIHYLSLTKSYFSNIDSINIMHGQDYFLIKGRFIDDNSSYEVYCGFQRDKRKVFKLNSKEYSRLSDHVGRYPVVMISPADSGIITEGSEERRKFMNGVISQYDRVYLDTVMRYNKALKNRNILLKQYGSNGNHDREMIQLWESQMIPLAETIHQTRDTFIKELIPVFQEYYSHISDNREKVELEYRSQLNDASMKSLFEKTYEKDRILQYTSAGPHRDDMLLYMNGYRIRDLGSQGQQKSYLVALKLAKFEYISNKGGIKPILLMDDIFDKFDSGRVRQIMKLVSENRFGQIFITDTNQERLKLILSEINIDYKLFKINHGVEEVISSEKDN